MSLFINNIIYIYSNVLKFIISLLPNKKIIITFPTKRVLRSITSSIGQERSAFSLCKPEFQSAYLYPFPFIVLPLNSFFPLSSLLTDSFQDYK